MLRENIAYLWNISMQICISVTNIHVICGPGQILISRSRLIYFT